MKSIQKYTIKNYSQISRDLSNLMDFSLDIPELKVIQNIKKDKNHKIKKNILNKKIKDVQNSNNHIQNIKGSFKGQNGRISNIKIKDNNIIKNPHQKKTSFINKSSSSILFTKKVNNNQNVFHATERHQKNIEYNTNNINIKPINTFSSLLPLNHSKSYNQLSNSSLNDLLDKTFREKDKFEVILTKRKDKLKKSLLLLSRRKFILDNDPDENFLSCSEGLRYPSHDKTFIMKRIQSKIEKGKKMKVKNNNQCSFNIQRKHPNLINSCDSYYKMEDQLIHERRKGIYKKYPLLQKKADILVKHEVSKRKSNKKFKSNALIINYLKDTVNKKIFTMKKKIEKFSKEL